MRRRFEKDEKHRAADNEEEEEVATANRGTTTRTDLVGWVSRSFDKLVALMYQPTDPASLGVARALFGLCMVIDVVEERGLANVDLKWGNPDTCHFPLIHGLARPSLPWMILIYSIMWLGAFGIMLGYRFKLACALFVLPYWYFFVLDKSFWNNHTYLYGIVASLLWSTGANRYLSLDGRNAAAGERAVVPYWNYFILKFQFFALYFLAGLKKSSREWLEGYSMTNLSQHWVFLPFRLVLSREQTDFYVVHWFAFLFDLTVGFFIMIERTRLPAMLLCATFHLMNSRLFSIGMFPYVCLATMPLFCRVDWPRKLGLQSSWLIVGSSSRREKSSGCRDDRIDDHHHLPPATEPPATVRRITRNKPNRRQKLVVTLLILHVALQLFLPYSHFITKGYNNWVPGLYGYSWDMMVHAWDTVLAVVRVRDNQTRKDYFIDPGAWEPNDRWMKHGDMVRQYAFCIKDNLLRNNNINNNKNNDNKREETVMAGAWPKLSSNLSIYVDIWCSLNGRFQQRLFDPTVDLLTAEWHPLKPVPYVLPLLRQFSSYRIDFERIQDEVYSWSNYTDVLFVADYPGFGLEQYVDSAVLANVSLHVLEGEVALSAEGCGERTIGKGGHSFVPADAFHMVLTTGPHPACYMYTFANRTRQQLANPRVAEQQRPLVVKAREAFPILKEIGYKIDAFGRAVGHVVNALLHLTCGVPIVRRIQSSGG